MKTWNLGNTTVRNPERIKDALRVFRDEFAGRKFDIPTQNEFFISLIRAGVIKGDPNQAGSRDWSARKWASAFNKLGLALPRGTKSNPVVTITDAGEALLSEDSLASDIFLRQMLKIQLPSPTEDNLDGASIHPFYLVLSVAVELVRRNMKPLGKEEIALFLQSATNDNQTGEIVDSISHYREARDAITGRIGKRKFFLDSLLIKATHLYGDAVTKQKMGTMQDYSDTTVRYSAITGVFTIGRQSLSIKEDQLNLAFAIVDAGIPHLCEETDFLGVFHNPSLPALPTDDVDFLESDIEALKLRLDELSLETGATISSRENIDGANIAKLKRRREDLEDELTALKEIQFYRSQHNEDQVEDIKGLFESIANRETIGGSDYLPAWAEWNVWRVFLSINTIANPISDTRGFKINSELFPIHHAKGGQSDLRFEYEDGTIVPAEITLSSNERQFNMEGEPVKFHVKTIIEKNQSSEVIGLFTAPDVHVSTAHEFFGADFYSSKIGGVVKMNIVPLTFNQLQSLLPGQKNSCENGSELLSKLRGLINLKDSSEDGSVWLDKINHTLAV
jgi:AlwI restriction endonuclease